MSSPTTKIAAIGAGSFVFTQRLLHDVICRHRMAGCELVLMDLDAELAETMAAIARRMAADTDVTLTISSTGDRAVALRGADFVTASVAAQLLRRYEMDREVLRRHGIREPNAECGGLGGLSYTLRQVPLLLAIARDMERLCPSAWLLNVSNPLPRLVTAVARHTAIKVAGFCNVAWGSDDGYGNVGRLLGRPAAELDVVSAGLNHFAWLLSVRDRRTGEDLLPAVAQPSSAAAQSMVR